LERWNQDGSHPEGLLQEADHKTSVQYANRENLLDTGGAKFDVALFPDDSLALGVAQALEGVGTRTRR